MNENIFTENFWLEKWENLAGTKDDTLNVHKGFATAEYWDKASLSYNTRKKEITDKKTDKIIKLLKSNKLIFNNCKVLDIGCGTGLLSRELAKNRCMVTAMDFSKGMIKRCNNELPENLKNKIDYLQGDWNQLDLKEMKWEKYFDLVVAFMSPATSTPASFFKMMKTTKNGCAIKGWATRKHELLDSLWNAVMGTPLEDKPQNILYKLNLLFSMGYFPEITFDKIKWEETISVENELKTQFAFFQKISTKSDSELKKAIKKHLESVAKNGLIQKKHEGLTATALWHIRPDIY